MSATLPSRLGRYEVLEEIGKGAMGVVYLARDPLIGRLVALKTFRVGFAAKDEELTQFRSRFVREAQSAGILSHPNIVTIHDVVDEGANGICFIAMEYVKGTNLKQQLQNADPFSHNFVVEVISQVAEALDYAHSRGVVHRDIKPANILITADNKVKITDFGIARLDTSNLTMEGQLLGTPNYMAPEQIQGKDVDHRADIFSLGVVFYEMLTRRKPFQGENLTQVTHKIVYEPFTPPEEIVRDLPQGLSAVLTRCLQKDPNRRFPRAAEVARELRAVLEQQQDSMDDTVATQEVAPGVPAKPAAAAAPASGAAPLDAGPTRKLDQGEIAAAVAAARAAMGEAEAPVDAGPTRKLDRAALLAEAEAVARQQSREPAAPPPPASAPPPPEPTQKLTPAPAAPSRKPAPPPAPTQKLTPAPAERPPAPRIPPAPAAPVPQPPAPAAPPPAPAQSATPKRPGGRRTLWLALAGGAALVVVATVLLFALGGREAAKPEPLPVAPTTSPEQQNRITAATALSEARTKFASGDLPGALQAVARAELADPQSLEAKLLREAIEKRTQELAAEAERQKQIADGVTAARDASARKDWDQAVSSARAVLALDPQQEEARQLLSDAQRSQRRERERAEAARASTTPKPANPEPAPVPVQPAPVAAAPPAAKDAPLRIDFASDQSEGVLTIYAGERQIFREPFKFVKKTGFLRSEKVSGTLEGQRRVPTGPLTLRVYVAMPGMPTKAVVLSGTIQGGKSYQLMIRVDADGRATAELK
jgi:predicted Ser/Thr protein kinase